MYATSEAKASTTNVEDAQLQYFLSRDKINDFDSFHPEKCLAKKYSNVYVQRDSNSLKCVFLAEYLQRVLILAVVTKNIQTATSPLNLIIKKQGYRVPLINFSNLTTDYAQLHNSSTASTSL